MFEACAAPEKLGLGVIAPVGAVDARRCRLGAGHAGRSGSTEPFYLWLYSSVPQRVRAFISVLNLLCSKQKRSQL